jgi:ABC-2 type transport system ATP-binding protein
VSNIVVDNFVKIYEKTPAVDGVSFTVNKGELFGLIGPDGAGKTTLIRSISTLIFPSKGTVSVNGMDVTQHVEYIRSIIGYMPQRFSLYQDLTVEQNLRFFADLFQVPQSDREKRLDQLYRFSRLTAFKNRRAGALSGGMKQKLALSCALIHTPKILILDEPTYGVDPISRQEFWNILQIIKKEGTTILVSTAYMDEATLCDRVALMFSGKIQAVDTPSQLQESYPYPLYRLTGRDLRTLATYFQRLSVVHTTQLFGDSLHVAFTENPTVYDWHKWKDTTKGDLLDWNIQKPSIEDIFLDLINKGNGHGE